MSENYNDRKLSYLRQEIISRDIVPADNVIHISKKNCVALLELADREVETQQSVDFEDILDALQSFISVKIDYDKAYADCEGHEIIEHLTDARKEVHKLLSRYIRQEAETLIQEKLREIVPVQKPDAQK